VRLGSLTVIWVALLAAPAPACEPIYYLLLREDARERLAPLEANPTPGNQFERIVLMHNLAFHKDKKMRKSAEELMSAYGPDSLEPAQVGGFRGSLQMIQVAHRSAGSKIFRTISPFSQSPQAEARAGFRRISVAVARDTTDFVLRLLRATAAAESAEHLGELYDSALCDLVWLRRHGPIYDSAVSFMMHLNWTKYYYKLARYEDDTSGIDLMQGHMELALNLACTPVYAAYARQWEERVVKIVAKMKKAARRR
jgi:hypothetical protein